MCFNIEKYIISYSIPILAFFVRHPSPSFQKENIEDAFSYGIVILLWKFLLHNADNMVAFQLKEEDSKKKT